MSESENRGVVERLFSAADARDWATMRRFYRSDATEEWPQSGELLNGVDNIMAVNENYPAHPALYTKRIRAAGDLVIGEAELDYGSRRPGHCASRAHPIKASTAF
ncbi:MAG: nuclear transport factor 2 family protein [Actinomycetota bacterium]|nr:nuclear transport factor 2 family protein [Actinomycetota bacterium]